MFISYVYIKHLHKMGSQRANHFADGAGPCALHGFHGGVQRVHHGRHNANGLRHHVLKLDHHQLYLGEHVQKYSKNVLNITR